jgi:hypothetical protein
MPAPSKRKLRRPLADPHRTLRAVTVENPYFSRVLAGDATNPRKISAVVNIRESAITLLASRNQIDAAQVAAATRFRALWEAMVAKARRLLITAGNMSTAAKCGTRSRYDR